MNISNYPLTVKEKHLDCFGHVNNAVYLELYEEARWELIQNGAWGLERIQREKRGPVVLELTLKFKRELKNRDQIVIKTQLKSITKNKIMHVEQWMENLEGEELSRLSLTLGMMDLVERKLMIFPEDWVRALGGA
jgi:YbgC/YbaW family acyl-CoA thioester hydrolase